MNFISSPETVNKLLKQSKVYFEEILKAPKLVNVTRQRG